MDYLNDLNPVQREAVEKTEGPSLVIAGAGSGKTRVLTYRIAHLLNKGVRPYTILALTFTNKAAREMKERIGHIVGSEQAQSLWMGTFHSTFAKILRYEAEYLGFDSNFTIYDTQDSKNLLRSIIKEMKLDDKVYKANDVLNRISSAKNNLVTAMAYAQNSAAQEIDAANRRPLTAEIYKRYSHRCRQANAMDFDDLLLQTNILFKNSPDVLAKYQAKFKYILVDEYQDTNYSQYLIVKRLAEQHKNVSVVGDDAQSIYSFRGAKIENILNFRNDYPSYQLFKLEQNYRSTKVIVNAANSVIKKNKGQIQKESFSEKEGGENIKVIKAMTDHEEGYMIANDIFETKMRNRLKFEDFAILYRTNAQSRIFEESLRKMNMPYKIYGGLSFYQRKEIKDLLSYFRMAVNPNDEEAIKRVINYPKRGIGATTIGKLQEAAASTGQSMWNIICGLNERPYGLNAGTISKLMKFANLINGFAMKIEHETAFELASRVSSETGIIKELYNDRSPEGVSRHENIQELLNAIQDFTQIALEEDRENKLANYLEDVALLTDHDNEKDEDRNKVTMMTIHSSKGLEFPYLYVVGMEEELFPSKLSTTSPHELEEERRLFYVALTRAQDRVSLSFAKARYKWGDMSYPRPSRFIKEIDPQYVDFAYEQEPEFSGFGTRISESDSSHERMENRTRFQQKKKPEMRPKLSQTAPRIRTANHTESNGKFEASDASTIQAGMQIEHQRFGKGKVLHLEGESPNIKATVFFQNVGQKQLLLKFAKLKIV
ncbi:DNA helicase-2/ATP-dependent DNA helicase PcrA [Ancylomarina subtilis]|uniref:DNA 3'-5' helicase n=1 Tax=Ancylomarina subtilis TaxID=1639035 RepID=A0A4Q7VLB8_9BACT|nr:UvrD-helicase domain-containing protein [Ancylomarina subtilis]RZT97071.1 DNA helicase-2/ATP-dependent DNA helicase PcrA [Ancylomarina subtilis]